VGFFSPEKLLILALIVTLVFGAKGLPTIARRAGKGIRQTRDALGLDEIRDGIGEVRSSVTELKALPSGEQAAATTAPESSPGAASPAPRTEPPSAQ
jgi:TatA/E family protein of Tat protein translocase